MTTEGILNGLAPWHAEMSADWEEVLYVVMDAEGGVSAIVPGGEEMAEFFAAKLNELALRTDGHLTQAPLNQSAKQEDR